jgi:hypothetical protein
VLITALVHGNERTGRLGAEDHCWRWRAQPNQGRLTLAFWRHLSGLLTDHGISGFVDEDLNHGGCPSACCEASQRRRRLALRTIGWADWRWTYAACTNAFAPLLLAGISRAMRLAKVLGNPAHGVVDAGRKDGVRMRDLTRFGELDPDRRRGRGVAARC